jgi:hypothetical protein
LIPEQARILERLAWETVLAEPESGVTQRGRAANQLRATARTAMARFRWALESAQETNLLTVGNTIRPKETDSGGDLHLAAEPPDPANNRSDAG